MPILGFGSSDCACCRSHLLYAGVAGIPEYGAFRTV